MENQKKGSLPIATSSSPLHVENPDKLISPSDREKLDRGLEEMARTRRQAEASAQNVRLS